MDGLTLPYTLRQMLELKHNIFSTSLLSLLAGDNKMGLCLYMLQYLNVYSLIKYFANMNLLGNEDLGKNLGGTHLPQEIKQPFPHSFEI